MLVTFDTGMQASSMYAAPCKLGLEVTFRESWVKGDVGNGVQCLGNEMEMRALRESNLGMCEFWVCWDLLLG